MQTQPTSTLGSLPSELRDLIHFHYVYDEEGYHFNHESGKFLSGSDCSPIDLALMYTCKTVAVEMNGLALKANTLTFSTAYSEVERIKAGRWGFLFASIA